MSYKTVVGFIGNFVSMGILAGKLKLTDPQNGIVACISNFLAALVFAAANSTALMVLGGYHYITSLPVYYILHV